MRLLTSHLKASPKTEWPNTLLLLALFLVFAFNVIGLLDFRSDVTLGMTIRAGVFSQADNSFGLPAVATSAEFMILFFSGLLLALLLPLLSPIGASILVLLLATPPIWLAVMYPNRSNIVPMQFDLLVLMVLFGINVLMKYFAETRMKQKLLDTFGQYVPPEIVEELSQQTKMLALDGEAKNITVFFCDLRHFTGMSEQLDSKEVVHILNEYFTLMTTILYKYGATIDKYIGDSIMAFWGAPLPQPDHARKAVLASFEMHREMHKLAPVFHAHGLPTPTIGIGINTGIMNVGNMGSRYRLAYTVIGDAVNLAFRLQGTTSDYGVATLVGENTATSFDDMAFRELDTVTVKGKTRVSRIYEPLCLKSELTPEQAVRLQHHQEALAAYYEGKRETAVRGFTHLARQYPADTYYRFMLDKLASASVVQEKTELAS